MPLSDIFKNKKVQTFIEGMEKRYRTNGFYNFYKKSPRGSAEIGIEGQPYTCHRLRKYLEKDWQRQFGTTPSENTISDILEVLDAIFWADRDDVFWPEYTALSIKELQGQFDKKIIQEVERLVSSCHMYIFYFDADGKLYSEEVIYGIPGRAFRNDLIKRYEKKYGTPPSSKAVAIAEKVVVDIATKNAENGYWQIKVACVKECFKK